MSRVPDDEKQAVEREMARRRQLSDADINPTDRIPQNWEEVVLKSIRYTKENLHREVKKAEESQKAIIRSIGHPPRNATPAEAAEWKAKNAHKKHSELLQEERENCVEKYEAAFLHEQGESIEDTEKYYHQFAREVESALRDPRQVVDPVHILYRTGIFCKNYTERICQKRRMNIMQDAIDTEVSRERARSKNQAPPSQTREEQRQQAAQLRQQSVQDAQRDQALLSSRFLNFGSFMPQSPIVRVRRLSEMSQSHAGRSSSVPPTGQQSGAPSPERVAPTLTIKTSGSTPTESTAPTPQATPSQPGSSQQQQLPAVQEEEAMEGVEEATGSTPPPSGSTIPPGVNVSDPDKPGFVHAQKPPATIQAAQKKRQEEEAARSRAEIEATNAPKKPMPHQTQGGKKAPQKAAAKSSKQRSRTASSTSSASSSSKGTGGSGKKQPPARKK